MSRGGRLARSAVIAAALLGLAAVAVTWDLGLQHWLAVFLGSSNTPGTPPDYNFLSGAGSIIIPPLLNGAAVGVAFWWHHQCQEGGCYRYARYQAAGGQYKVCRHHHPDLKGARPTAALIERHHLQHLARGGPRDPKTLVTRGAK